MPPSYKRKSCCLAAVPEPGEQLSAAGLRLRVRIQHNRRKADISALLGLARWALSGIGARRVERHVGDVYDVTGGAQNLNANSSLK